MKEYIIHDKVKRIMNNQNKHKSPLIKIALICGLVSLTGIAGLVRGYKIGLASATEYTNYSFLTSEEKRDFERKEREKFCIENNIHFLNE